MLQLYDKSHNFIGEIVHYKDLKIESEITSGDKTLSFTFLGTMTLENEMYVRIETDEFVIKEVPATSNSFPEIVCVLNLEELEKDMWKTFSVTESTIDAAAQTVLAGTGWTIGMCDVTKKRNAGMVQVSAKEVIQNLATAFMCDVKFDTINKTVSFYQSMGEDKGVYFISGLNLKKVQKKSTSYDYYTRIIPLGEDGLTIESVNDGKNYLENYQYSDKVLTYLWKDESYTDAQALKEDAELKLDDLSKPEKSYSVDVRNLAAQSDGYSILSYDLGDTVRLVDVNTGTMEKQRIKKITRYPDEPDRDSCEIANTVLTFEELQEKYQAASEIINYTISGNGRYTGTIKVSDILNFEDGLSSSSAIGGINNSITTMDGKIAAVELTVGELEVNALTVEKADLRYATIENLDATNATVKTLSGDYADFKTTTTDELATEKASITSLSGDLSTFKTTVSDELVTAKGWMLEGAIGDAQISNVSANKLTAGTIDASKINVTNLNADNLTVGTINGKLIGSGTVDLDSLAEEVPTKEYLDSVQSDLQNQIDGAIETFTATETPTLKNEPAVNWKDNATKAKHVGDVCYVLNESSAENGYCYRFANTGTASAPVYEWVLIKDSDVTKALKDLATAQGDISGLKSYDVENSKWRTETDSSIESLVSQTESLETELGTKVDTSTFNTVKQTAEANTASIAKLTTTVNSKADASTVTTLTNTVNTVKQTADKNTSSISSLTSKVDNATEDISALETKQSTLEQSLDGFKTTVSSTYVTKTAYDSKVTDLESDIDTATTTANTASANASTALSTANASVASVAVEYYVSTSATALSGGSWSTTQPTWTDGSYIWARTKTTTKGGTVSYSNAACVTGATGTQGTKGDKGDTGATGNGVKSIVPQYYLSTSSTTRTGGSWSSAEPTWKSGTYIWTRSYITWTNGTTSTTTPVLATTLNTLNTRVTTAETNIEQNKKAITLKASQSDVDSLGTRLTSAESSIKVNATGIASKVDKNGVISSINQSAESVTIDAKRVNLNGSVTISDFANDALGAVTSTAYDVDADTATLTDESGNIITDESGNTILAVEAGVVTVTAKDGSGIATFFFQNQKVSMADFTAHLGEDSVPYTKSGYIVFNISTGAWLYWCNDGTWKKIAVDGSGASVTPSQTADVFLASYTKTSTGVTVGAYGSPQSYRDIKYEVMLSEWAADAVSETTEIDGGLIKTNTVIADKIATGAITTSKLSAKAVTMEKLATDAVTSTNYQKGTSPFSVSGTKIDLSNGSIESEQFGVTSDGTATFKGNLSAPSGNIAGWKIGNKALYNGTNSTTSTTTGTYIGTDGIRNYKSTSAYVDIKDGAITANSGDIGGWSIEDGLSSVATYNSKTCHMLISPLTGFWAYVDNPNNVNAFRATPDGYLSCTNITVMGTSVNINSGDSITIETFATAGAFHSTTRAFFMIPINRLLTNVTSVSVTISKICFRQNGKYVAGTTVAGIAPKSVTALIRETGIYVAVDMSASTNVTAYDATGIWCSDITIKFS